MVPQREFAFILIIIIIVVVVGGGGGGVVVVGGGGGGVGVGGVGICVSYLHNHLARKHTTWSVR